MPRAGRSSDGRSTIFIVDSQVHALEFGRPTSGDPLPEMGGYVSFHAKRCRIPRPVTTSRRLGAGIGGQCGVRHVKCDQQREPDAVDPDAVRIGGGQILRALRQGYREYQACQDHPRCVTEESFKRFVIEKFDVRPAWRSVFRTICATGCQTG